MLACVFRHWPVADLARSEYEARLVAFHEALAESRVPGFRGSVVFRVTGAPGMAPEQAGYEDWYLVEDWTAVGVLNAAAVTGARKTAHDAVARLAGAGAGGIYALAYGHPACDAGYRLRIDKPAGVPYSSFEADLLDVVGSWATVWKRQMVLGPDREYLVDAPSRPHRTLLGQPLTVAELRPVRSARTT